MTTEELQTLLDATTPGPWTMEVEAEPEYGDPAAYVCHWGTVCDATTVCNLAPSGAASAEQRHANARAIATWPTIAAELIAARARVAAAGKLADAVRAAQDMQTDYANATVRRIVAHLSHAITKWEASK